MSTKQYKLKRSLIYLIVAIITLACFLMNGPMRGGLPLATTLTDRITFISQHQTLWALSWFVWMLSALGLFVFCTILADELPKSFLRTAGVAFVGLGIAPDLIAEVLYAFVIPKVIIAGLNHDLVAVLEIIAMHLTGFLGNGLYNLGGLLLTCLAIKHAVVQAWVALWGVLAWLLGLLLSLSIALNALKAAEFFTATSMVLSTAWMLIFAHKVLKP